MSRRLELQTTLEELLGSKNVYYQPPESVKMSYPAIVYSKTSITGTKADNTNYLKRNRYEIVVIAKLPDSAVIDKILDLPYSSYDRCYKSDNLYHDTIRLYF